MSQQGSSGHLVWFLVDNTFCVCFYLLAIFVLFIRNAISSLPYQSTSESLIVSILYDLNLSLIHVLMLASLKVIYNKFKTVENEIRDHKMTAEEYGEAINKRRNQLNEGYECPHPLGKFSEIVPSYAELLLKSNVAPDTEELSEEENLYEPLEIRPKIVYEELVINKQNSADSNIYNEL